MRSAPKMIESAPLRASHHSFSISGLTSATMPAARPTTPSRTRSDRDRILSNLVAGISRGCAGALTRPARGLVAGRVDLE
jgi:hypothetical protein